MLTCEDWSKEQIENHGPSDSGSCWCSSASVRYSKNMVGQKINNGENKWDQDHPPLWKLEKKLDG